MPPTTNSALLAPAELGVPVTASGTTRATAPQPRHRLSLLVPNRSDRDYEETLATCNCGQDYVGTSRDDALRRVNGHLAKNGQPAAAPTTPTVGGR